MRFLCGTPYEKVYKDKLEWHHWYAWYPVRILNKDETKKCWFWFEYVERKREDDGWTGYAYYRSQRML